MAKEKKGVGEWVVFLQGAMLSLWICVACMFVLAWVLVKGVLPERIETVVAASVMFFSAMIGSVVVSNRSSLPKVSASVIGSGLFAVILVTVGLIGWRETLLCGSGVALVVCVFAGGVTAGVWNVGRRKRRKRKVKVRAFAK